VDNIGGRTGRAAGHCISSPSSSCIPANALEDLMIWQFTRFPARAGSVAGASGRARGRRRAAVTVAAAMMLTLVSALPAAATAKPRPVTYRPTPAITTAVETHALSGVGRMTDITITSSGSRPLYVRSITQDGSALTNSCVRTPISPHDTCTFSIGWSGGPGGGPNGPTVAISSNAPTSPTSMAIPYQ
jgi:hypothetical protein